MLVTVDILGDVQVHRMDISCQAAAQYSDEQLGAQIDLSFENLGDMLIYGVIWIGPLALGLGLQALKHCSWDMPKLLVGIAIWFVAFIAYIGFLLWSYDNGYQAAWECLFIMVGLLIMLLMSSGLTFGLVNGFRVFRMLWSGNLMLGIVASVIGISVGAFETVCAIGWNFPITVMEVIALIICAWYVGIFLGMALAG